VKSLIFVDDEPRVLQGLQRQLHAMRNEWEMSFVESGAQALEFMATTPVDVIVSDMMMPSMDGAELLTAVMKRHPNTVRIVLSGHADRESVLRLVGPAHQYLSKPCNAEELRNAITRSFALRDLLTSEQLKQLATRIRTLPTLPSLHAQLTEELRAEEPSMERISEIISKDIGMTSKILQLVNSAFFGLPQPIANVQEAVIYLGLATVRALVLSLQVFSQFEQKTIKGFSIETLAQHSWRVGVFARRIAEAERCDPKVDDQCFLAGLLHDLGQLILASGLPDDYARVIETARSRHQTIWEAEKIEFGATHAEVGAYLLGLWGLPNPVIEAVALHHRPGDASASAFSPVVAVHVANAFEHDQTGTHPQWPGNEINIAHLAALGLDGRVDSWRERCQEDNL
jgi:HD-like signal output (HDOD) protein